MYYRIRKLFAKRYKNCDFIIFEVPDEIVYPLILYYFWWKVYNTNNWIVLYKEMVYWTPPFSYAKVIEGDRYFSYFLNKKILSAFLSGRTVEILLLFRDRTCFMTRWVRDGKYANFQREMQILVWTFRHQMIVSIYIVLLISIGFQLNFKMIDDIKLWSELFWRLN